MNKYLILLMSLAVLGLQNIFAADPSAECMSKFKKAGNQGVSATMTNNANVTARVQVMRMSGDPTFPSADCIDKYNQSHPGKPYTDPSAIMVPPGKTMSFHYDYCVDNAFWFAVTMLVPTGSTVGGQPQYDFRNIVLTPRKSLRSSLCSDSYNIVIGPYKYPAVETYAASLNGNPMVPAPASR